jgi:hypothetical protein
MLKSRPTCSRCSGNQAQLRPDRCRCLVLLGERCRGWRPSDVIRLVRLLQEGGWKPARQIAVALGLAGIVLISLLVVSGHLPPRGLVTGSVHSFNPGDTPFRLGKPFSQGTLVFHQVGSSEVFRVTTDSEGQYSITLPPGTYRVLPDRPGGCLVPIPHLCLGAPGVTVMAGQHVVSDFVFPGLKR